MYDPIVNEVRKAREEIARRANYDISTIFDIVKEDVKKLKENMELNGKEL